MDKVKCPNCAQLSPALAAMRASSEELAKIHSELEQRNFLQAKHIKELEADVARLHDKYDYQRLLKRSKELEALAHVTDESSYRAQAKRMQGRIAELEKQLAEVNAVYVKWQAETRDLNSAVQAVRDLRQAIKNYKTQCERHQNGEEIDMHAWDALGHAMSTTSGYEEGKSGV